MDVTERRAALEQRDAAWSALAASGGDVEEIVDFWTADAVVIPPGMPPVVGTAALREYVAGASTIPGFRISWSAGDIDLSADGTMAWIRQDNLVEMTGENGEALSSVGRAVTVWRLEGETWRCCADVWNSL
ncbi:YybH family protein [Nocardioides sp.]|uniref:YybH family protein n=1 Tax=Nocardioides sp. TaxID=35761 RepID=UPI002B275C11|nr:nuclear transport factor 2 family protein [Nocardioides sp.]